MCSEWFQDLIMVPASEVRVSNFQSLYTKMVSCKVVTGTVGSSDDACMHSLKIMMICNNYGLWNETILEKDKAFAQEVHTHLQSVSKYVRAMDLVDFLDTDTEEMQTKTGHKKRIDVATAQRWMKKLNYQWTLDLKGQYVDGHKRAEVVTYRQHAFLPAWKWAQSRS